MSDAVGSYVESIRGEFEARLSEWVAFPTVSASPIHRADIDNAASAAAGYLRSLGAAAEVVPTAGNPVVWGKFASHPSHPTVTIYNHLDVQPAEEPGWNSAPFQLDIRSGTYFGRGSTDDKGPALAALFAARYSNLHKLPLNIQFIWEFEEEIGSPNFEAFIKDRLDDLRTDSVVISDTVWISRDRPAIPFGLRGLLSFSFSLETAKRDVHSGLTGGGARNPLNELCVLIAQCYDGNTRRILVPGFYENVLPVPDEEIEGYLASGFATEIFCRDHELLKTKASTEAELLRNIWTRPTFEVHGFVGGYTGPGVKTSIPPRAEVKVSMRLVPDQNPERQFRLVKAFAIEQLPDVEVTLDSTLRPFLGHRFGPHADAARVAMRDTFGTEPAWVREGGSIGAVATIRDYLKAPIIFLGLSLPEHGYHSANENFDWRQAGGGMRMFTRYFEQIAEIPPS